MILRQSPNDLVIASLRAIEIEKIDRQSRPGRPRVTEIPREREKHLAISRLRKARVPVAEICRVYDCSRRSVSIWANLARRYAS